MTKQYAAKRARDKSERKGPKGKNESDCRGTIRKEGAGKNQGGGGGV
jgi:hypothetical protein